MTKDDQMRFCLMLAFQSVIAQGNGVESETAVQKIVGLAKLMNEFCDLHVPQSSPEESEQ